MNIARLAFVATTLVVSASVWAGGGPVGAWKGHIVFDTSKMSLKDPAQIQTAKQQVAAAQKIQVTLTLKADKTFSGAPPPATGTWAQKGNTITLNQKGKPGPGQVFTLSKDGKTMTTPLPTSAGIVAKIVLKRG